MLLSLCAWPKLDLVLRFSGDEVQLNIEDADLRTNSSLRARAATKVPLHYNYEQYIMPSNLCQAQ